MGEQEDWERSKAHSEALQGRVKEYKEALLGTRRDMRRAARTLKTYEVCFGAPGCAPLKMASHHLCEPTLRS